MKIVNEENLRAGFEKMRADLEPLKNLSGARGASARMQIVAGEAINRAIVAEYERETLPADLAVALRTFVANAVMSFMKLIEWQDEAAEKRGCVDFCTLLYSDLLYRLDDKNIEGAHFIARTEQGGRA